MSNPITKKGGYLKNKKLKNPKGMAFAIRQKSII
jgi:hypothetical protein